MADTPETPDYFAPLRGERHMSLATFRRNGEAVPHRSGSPKWKVSSMSARRRISRNWSASPTMRGSPWRPAVKVVKSTGEELPALARILAPGDPAIAEAESALGSRYPAERPAMNQLMQDNGWKGVHVEIRPPNPG